MKNIISALIKAQKTIKHAQKDAKNPHFKNHYATLESVIDATKDSLLENEIVVTHIVTKENILVTTLLHSSGEQITSEMNLLNATNMQQMGSSITYARRYSLAALLNISQIDEDGNDTGGNNNKVSPDLTQTSPLEYVVTIGKNKGKKFGDIPEKARKDLYDYLIKSGKEKPLTGGGAEYVKVYEHYLDSVNSVDREPQFDKDEKIPF